MLKWLAGYAAGGVVFLALDAIWLGILSREIYRPVLSPMLADRINIGAASAFYLIYVTGVLFLAVQPAVKAQSFGTALATGAFLGLVAYATYDLTNLATLKMWSVKVAVIDIAWGVSLTAVTAGAAYLAVMAAGGSK
jgi:uncharacterized membrane protein